MGAASLNGMLGKLQRFDESTGRWDVVTNPSTKLLQRRGLSIRPINLMATIVHADYHRSKFARQDPRVQATWRHLAPFQKVKDCLSVIMLHRAQSLRAAAHPPDHAVCFSARSWSHFQGRLLEGSRSIWTFFLSTAIAAQTRETGCQSTLTRL